MHLKAQSWLSPVGASIEAIRELQSEVEGLPSEYIELLREGNGGEVGLKVNPFNLCLDSAEDALDYWRSGTYTMKGVFVFGGNGGGVLFAFDMRTPGVLPVISYDPIDPEGNIENVASSFDKLISLIEEEDA